MRGSAGCSPAVRGLERRCRGERIASLLQRVPRSLGRRPRRARSRRRSLRTASRMDRPKGAERRGPAKRPLPGGRRLRFPEGQLAVQAWELQLRVGLRPPVPRVRQPLESAALPVDTRTTSSRRRVRVSRASTRDSVRSSVRASRRIADRSPPRHLHSKWRPVGLPRCQRRPVPAHASRGQVRKRPHRRDERRVRSTSRPQTPILRSRVVSSPARPRESTSRARRSWIRSPRIRPETRCSQPR